MELGIVGACLCTLLFFYIVVPCKSEYKEVNQKCREVFTKADPHMSAYVGQIFTIEAMHKTKDKYRYVVGVCVDVGEAQYHDCGVMQYGTDGNLTHCLGKVDTAQVARSRDGVWIELTYSMGSSYGSHCNFQSRTARLVFFCDPYISGKGDIDFLEENNEDNICYYLFNISSRTVCGFPGNLSAGEIIMIIFAVLVLLWLVAMIGGLLFKRFVVGAKGWEQIPFLEWYKALANLEADGCDLVCRSRPTHVVKYKEPTFGEETDDDEEENDDNLLPM